MQSVRSSFNQTLFLKNLTRFWPIWGAYGAIWLYLFIAEASSGWDAGLARTLPLESLCFFGIALAAVFGIIAAMAVFSYLYSSRSVDMLHALPMRRGGLFLTNYISGLCFFLLPHGVVFLLLWMAELLSGTAVLGSLLMWLTAQSLMCFFFYSFAVFCAMFTGHILALPVFYGIFNGLAGGLNLLLQTLAQEFIYGYWGTERFDRLALTLTPALNLVTTLRVRYDLDPPQFYGLHLILFYALFGVVFTGLALLVYEKRHLETAGDVVAVSKMKPVFKYGVGFCAAIAFGTFLYENFRGSGSWDLLGYLLVCGAVGYFAAEMLLQKSFRVFRRGWKGCAVLLVCIIAAVSAMDLDLFRFERRVPQPYQVESVVLVVDSYPSDSLCYSGWAVERPEEVEQVLKLHQAVVDRKKEFDRQDYRGYWRQEEEDGVSVTQADVLGVRLSYQMKDGSVMFRAYDVPVTAEELSDLESPSGLLHGILNTPALVEDAYFAGVAEDDQLVRAEVSMVWLEEDPQEQNGTTQNADHYTGVQLPTEALPELLEAVRRDLAAGRLGRRYLLGDRQRLENCYLSDLELTFLRPKREDAGDWSASYPDNQYVRIGLETTAVDTLAVLEKYGVIGPDARLVTHAEEQRRSAQVEYAQSTGEPVSVPGGAVLTNGK